MNREVVVSRIKQILSYIDDKNLATALKENEKIFSEKELLELLGFLESWDYSILYDLLKEKIEEYRDILNKVNILKSKVKLEKIWNKEIEEKEKEEEEIENLIAF